MVKQIIKFSDGTETVINYKGVVVNGELIPDKENTMSEEVQEEVTEGAVEAPEVTPEVVETAPEVVEPAPEE